MPRSQNRRYLEIPTALYDTLAEQAKAESRTVAQVAADLIVDGQTLTERIVPLETQIREMRRDIEILRLAVENRLPPWPLPSAPVAPTAEPDTTPDARQRRTSRKPPRQQAAT